MQGAGNKIHFAMNSGGIIESSHHLTTQLGKDVRKDVLLFPLLNSKESGEGREV